MMNSTSTSTSTSAPSDPFAPWKAVQREGWGHFAPLEAITTIPAAKLVNFTGIKAGQKVLDLACGTGVVAVTASRLGAQVTGLDLSPVLLERARYNAELSGQTIELLEGDAEALPFDDASFDVVISQFGHMFAPRPALVFKEMLRVLRPGGRMAFSTWPPELYTGSMFALMGKYLPPPPEGASPPPQWGDPNIIRERLGKSVKNLQFWRELMVTPGLSLDHLAQMFQTTAGPLVKLTHSLKDNPAKLQELRQDMKNLLEPYFHDNQLHQHFLMTRADKN